MDKHGLRDWLYRLAAEMTDGPDAPLGDKLKAFADDAVKPAEGEAPPPEVNPNPDAPVSSPTNLAPVAEPLPEGSGDPFTPAQMEALRKLLAK